MRKNERNKSQRLRELNVKLNPTLQLIMSLRILLATCIALACFSQIQCIPFPFDCNATLFMFYNDYNPDSIRAPAMKWDYRVNEDGFDDGTSDTFDGFLIFYVQVLHLQYVHNLNNLIGARCDLDHINDTQNPYAAAEFYFSMTNGFVTVNTTRSFFVPINTNWIRVIDTVTHNSGEPQNMTMYYYGRLGSRLETVLDAQSDYYVASSDGRNGTLDTTFALNFAGWGGALPTQTSMMSHQTNFGWQFEYKTLPPGKNVSIMHILSQGRSVPDAVNSVRSIFQQPLEIYQNLDANIISQIQNWDMCGAVFDVVAKTICVTPAHIKFNTNIAGRALTVSNVTVVAVPDSGEISLELLGGTYEFSWTRAPVCGAKTRSYTAGAPQENLAVQVQNSGNFQASATGGYGSYQFEWILNGYNLSSAFDNGATVIVTDAVGCSVYTTVDLPALDLNNGQSQPTVSMTSTSVRVLPVLITLALSVVVYFI